MAGYGLIFSALLITAGRLGDRVGRRRLLAVGLAVFALASAGCGLAPDAGTLIAFRLLQGVGGAIISPTVLSIIGVTWEGPAWARAIGIYGTVLGLAASSGQLIGGLLIQADPAGLGWRSVFLINLPVAAVGLALLPRCVPESKAPGPVPLDWTGTALVTAGVTAVVLPLVQGRQYGWPWWSIAGLAAAPVILAAFVASQVRRGRLGGGVLIDMTTVKERAIAAGLVTQLGLWCGQASFFMILALYLQQGRRLDAMQAGLVFTVMAGSYTIASLRSAPLAQRFGRAVIGAGAAVLAAGHGLLLAAVAAEGTGGTVAWLAPGLVLVGVGMGLCIAPLSTVVLSACGPSQAGATSGVLSTVQQVGNSVGVGVVGVVFFGALHGGYGHAFGPPVRRGPRAATRPWSRSPEPSWRSWSTTADMTTPIAPTGRSVQRSPYAVSASTGPSGSTTWSARSTSRHPTPIGGPRSAGRSCASRSVGAMQVVVRKPLPRPSDRPVRST